MIQTHFSLWGQPQEKFLLNSSRTDHVIRYIAHSHFQPTEAKITIILETHFLSENQEADLDF